MPKRGRPKGSTNSALAGELKGILLQAVLDDIKENPDHAVLWAEKFSSRLLPNTIDGSGKDGEIEIKIFTDEQIKTIAARALCQKEFSNVNPSRKNIEEN